MSTDPLQETRAMTAFQDASRRIELECIRLEVVTGPEAGFQTSFSLTSLRLGSASDNDLVLTDPTVSRHHAEIRITAKGLVVRDLASTNGTFCNRVRVIEAYLDSDVVCALGNTHVRVVRDVEERRYEVGNEHRLGSLVGTSEPMRELYGLLRVVAPSAATVLVNGESGCGKEVVARTLHELSGRRGPLVVFDASVTDPEMVRNDLFGHVKGAFTGAHGARDGAFRRAHGGTLFIDEIGELPLDLQPRLLRALESREVVPVGADEPVKVDVRVVAATHRDLETMVQQGAFRADLFYRMSVVTVPVPPLRVIKKDIPLLARSFEQRLGFRCSLSDSAIRALYSYDWPGNVRELRNVLERAALLSGGRNIEPEHLRLNSAGQGQSERFGLPVDTPASPSRGDTPANLKDFERQMIEVAMMRNGGNKAAVARELGMSLSTLKRRIAQYGS